MLGIVWYALWLVSISPFGAEPAEAKLEGLEIIQESNGIPGRAQDEVMVQQIQVTRDRMRLEDRASGIDYLFRLDLAPPRIWEISADRKQYRDGNKLGNLQRDRDRAERQTLEQLSKGPRAEFEQYLRENYLREDGKRDVKLEKVAGASPELLGHATVRYVVRENERVVVDVLVTEELDVEIAFFDFYRRVGAFSDEVLKVLKQIPGVPLKAKITVVTAGLSYPIEATAKEVTKKWFPSSLFELPEGATERVESPFAPCPWCKEDVEKKAPGDKSKMNNRSLYFCSREHKTLFWKKRMEEAKKR